jgi:hypothetical protein
MPSRLVRPGLTRIFKTYPLLCINYSSTSTNGHSAPSTPAPAPERSTTNTALPATPPPSPTRPGQPTRRHPPRLPAPPHPLQRTHRLGTPSNRPSRLTTYTPGMSTGVVGSQGLWRKSAPLPGCLQNSQQNGGSVLLIFMADPTTIRLYLYLSGPCPGFRCSDVRSGRARTPLADEHIDPY